MTRPPKTKTIPKGRTLKTKGLLIIHTGDGKGKTTAALGLAFRALGCGFKVFMVQFIKGNWKYGELESAKRFEGALEIYQAGEGFTWDVPDDKRQRELAKAGWEKGRTAMESGTYRLVIFDEINYVLDYGYLPVSEVVEALKNKSRDLHVCLTGRNAPKELIEIADLVTEMKEIKHPFREGIVAQRGIEF